MKICYVGRNVPLLFQLVKDMADRGHEVHWIALSIPKCQTTNVHTHLEILYKRNFILGKYVSLIYNFIKFKAIIKKISPDILHTINIRKAGWYAVFCGFDPVILTPQGGDIKSKERDYSLYLSSQKWIRQSYIYIGCVPILLKTRLFLHMAKIQCKKQFTHGQSIKEVLNIMQEPISI